MDIEIPKVRKMDLDEIVKVELPAFVWIQYMSAYYQAPWTDGSATIIAGTVRNLLLDPQYLNEQDARLQEQQDMANRAHQGMLGAIGIPFHPPDDPRFPPQ